VMEDLPMFKPVQRIRDGRGLISVFDFTSDIPFVPKRVFMLTDVPKGVERGGHGHKKCQQYLASLVGEWELNLASIDLKRTLKLSENSDGVYMPINTYLTMKPLSEGAVLCVFASEAYDPDDYFYELPV